MNQKRELTLEEKIQQQKERELDYIRPEIPFINEPTIHYQMGEQVRLGNLKDCIIDDILYDGKIYGIRCITHSGKTEVPTYRITAWHDIQPLTYKETNFEKMQPVSLYFNTCDIYSLICDYYHFGIDTNPDYQREIVWTQDQKEALLDSIFKHIDIGKFVLYKPEENSVYDKMYEIVDGKQRLTAIIEYYENRFPYQGIYYRELSPKDKHCFKNHKIQVAKLSNIDRATVLQQFILLNTTGTPMDKTHLNKVAQLLEEEQSNLNKPASMCQI